MTENLELHKQRTLPQRMIQKIGELVGTRPPEWFDQQVWDDSTRGQRRMIKMMHYYGGEGFNVARSAEAPLIEFRRGK